MEEQKKNKLIKQQSEYIKQLEERINFIENTRSWKYSRVFRIIHSYIMKCINKAKNSSSNKHKEISSIDITEDLNKDDITLLQNSKYFNDEYYLKNYPHVKDFNISPIEHYLLYGAKEAKNPSQHFNTKLYRIMRDDIDFKYTNPLVHFIKHGYNEGRPSYAASIELTDFISNYDFKYSRCISFSELKGSVCCVYAHFSTDDTIDNYVINYLNSLNTISNLDIVFVTTCINITDKEIHKLNGLVSSVIVRENVGYDFGSYKVGYDYINQYGFSYDTLIIANDSCYCVSDDLVIYYEKMQSKDFDFWGMSDSYRQNYHLQSYFLVFNQRVLYSEAFEQFWVHLKNITDISLLIQMYEIGLSVMLQICGFKMGAVCEVKTVCAQNPNINLTMEKADTLIEDYNFPFLKKKAVLHKSKFLKAVNDLCIFK